MRNRDDDIKGQYFTDGKSLFRALTRFGRPPHGGLVSVEDCRSFEILLITLDDLRRLRRVAPVAAPATRVFA
jgi:hypothetical protein